MKMEDAETEDITLLQNWVALSRFPPFITWNQPKSSPEKRGVCAQTFFGISRYMSHDMLIKFEKSNRSGFWVGLNIAMSLHRVDGCD